MKIGLYSNFLLTIIAVALIGILLNDLGLIRNGPFKKSIPVDVLSFCGHDPYTDTGVVGLGYFGPKGLPVTIHQE
jgi:hypothetical protein